MTGTVLDHVAIGTRALDDGWELFGGILGGTWAYGGDSAGFWWGQLQFGSGPKIELITPDGGPDSAFLERFLTARGSGPHHLNFIVPDISATLGLARALGIEPVQVSLDDARWKEAFLHPRDAYGIVIQVAETSGPPPELAAPAALGSPGPSAGFTLVEHLVDDVGSATRLFRDVLAGDVVSEQGDAAELCWQNGARLRLRQRAPAESANHRSAAGGALGRLSFTRSDGPFSPHDLGRAAELSGRLGVSLLLGG